MGRGVSSLPHPLIFSTSMWPLHTSPCRIAAVVIGILEYPRGKRMGNHASSPREYACSIVYYCFDLLLHYNFINLSLSLSFSLSLSIDLFFILQYLCEIHSPSFLIFSFGGGGGSSAFKNTSRPLWLTLDFSLVITLCEASFFSCKGHSYFVN